MAKGSGSVEHRESMERPVTPCNIALDIDDTIHDYHGQITDAMQSLGLRATPYQQRHDYYKWSLDTVSQEQLHEAFSLTRQSTVIHAAPLYDGVQATVNGWKADGHRIILISARNPDSHGDTVQWLHTQGLAYDELICVGLSPADRAAGKKNVSKKELFSQHRIHLVVDDSPATLYEALDLRMHAATIEHPWTQALHDHDEIIVGKDWRDLQRQLKPLLAHAASQRPGRRGDHLP